ncbi:MAG: MarR family transcriptional regulator [Dehalococcoidia bacterium]
MKDLTGRMMAVFVWMARYYDARFEELGLTSATARALLQLDPDQPVPTRELAHRLSCDPSNVTAFVDRLEEAGFIERRVAPQDRRVKTLAMTETGRQMLDRLLTLQAADIPPLQRLSEAERRTLLELMDKAWAACHDYDPSALRPGSAPGS